MTKSHLFTALTIALATSLAFRSSVIVLTPSIDKTLLIKTGGDHFSTGDYVMTSINDEIVGNQKITKQVGCVPGQILSRKDRELFCDGVSLGTAKTHSKTGVPLTATNNLGVIIDGYVYLQGTHIDSYDSRYFGLVKTEKLTKLFPIF